MDRQAMAATPGTMERQQHPPRAHSHLIVCLSTSGRLQERGGRPGLIPHVILSAPEIGVMFRSRARVQE